MKPNPKQLLLLEHQYSKMLSNFIELMSEYREALIATALTSELSTFRKDSDFTELGRDAFMYKLKDIYEVNRTKNADLYYSDNQAMQELIKDVNNILDTNNKL